MITDEQEEIAKRGYAFEKRSRKEMTACDENRAEAERELWRRCSEGDEEAREELILAYRPMVYWLAKTQSPIQYLPGSYPGRNAFTYQRCRSFRRRKNNCFSTLAYYKIKGGMINFIQRVESKAPIPTDDETVFMHESLQSGSASEHADRAEWTLDLAGNEQPFPKRG